MLAFHEKTSGDPACDHFRTILLRAGLRPTRQRVALAGLLFRGPHRHFTAEELHREAVGAHLPVSLATIYNTLRHFCEAGMVRTIVVDPARSYFDTNVTHHFHYFDEGRQMIFDVPDGVFAHIAPSPPQGYAIERVDVVVRVRRSDTPR